MRKLVLAMARALLQGVYAQAATLLQNLLMVCLLALLHVNVLMYMVSRPLGKGAQAL